MKKIVRLCFAAAAITGLGYLVYRNRLALRGLLRSMWSNYCTRRNECDEFEDL